MGRKDFIHHRKRTYGRESHCSVEIVVTFKKNVTSASNICLSQTFSCFCICMFKSEVLKSKVKNPRKQGNMPVNQNSTNRFRFRIPKIPRTRIFSKYLVKLTSPSRYYFFQPISQNYFSLNDDFRHLYKFFGLGTYFI